MRRNHREGQPPGSVSRLIGPLQAGDQAAVRNLWERYFQPLVRVARNRLHGGRCRDAGPEDVALDAFLDFCRCLARSDASERFPSLHNRDHLWKLLVCFTVRTAFDFNRRQARRAAVVAGESALGEEGFAPFAGREPAPEFAAAVADLLDQLPDDTLRRVAVLRMEGHTVAEIARQLGCAVSTVERKLAAVRVVWKKHQPGEGTS